MVLQAEHYSTYINQTQLQDTMLSPDSGGLDKGLEVKNLLNLATAFTPGFVGCTFIYSPSESGWEAWVGVGRGPGRKLWSQ